MLHVVHFSLSLLHFILYAFHLILNFAKIGFYSLLHVLHLSLYFWTQYYFNWLHCSLILYHVLNIFVLNGSNFKVVIIWRAHRLKWVLHSLLLWYFIVKLSQALSILCGIVVSFKVQFHSLIAKSGSSVVSRWRPWNHLRFELLLHLIDCIHLVIVSRSHSEWLGSCFLFLFGLSQVLQLGSGGSFGNRTFGYGWLWSWLCYLLNRWNCASSGFVFSYNEG